MSSAYPILLVEDDALDAKAIRLAFGRVGGPHPLYRASDGLDALNFLRREGPYSGFPVQEVPRPGLILLDLRMPRLDGVGFLRARRDCEDLVSIPTVVLSTSTYSKDSTESYILGATGYVAKPDDDAGYDYAVQTVLRYWQLCRRCAN